MSVRSHWKTRAAERAQQPKWGPSPIAGLVRKPFDLIFHELQKAAKERIPQMAQSIDDPTSNLNALLQTIAQADAELWSQVEALAGFLENHGVKVK